mgnify:CR=1 FL=1
MSEGISINTISDMGDNGMPLGLFCLSCQRLEEITPSVWLADGKPDLDYVGQNFRCSECGGSPEKQVQWQPVTEQARFRGLSPTETRMDNEL